MQPRVARSVARVGGVCSAERPTATRHLRASLVLRLYGARADGRPAITPVVGARRARAHRLDRPGRPTQRDDAVRATRGTEQGRTSARGVRRVALPRVRGEVLGVLRHPAQRSGRVRVAPRRVRRLHHATSGTRAYVEFEAAATVPFRRNADRRGGLNCDASGDQHHEPGGTQPHGRDPRQCSTARLRRCFRISRSCLAQTAASRLVPVLGCVHGSPTYSNVATRSPPSDLGTTTRPTRRPGPASRR